MAGKLQLPSAAIRHQFLHPACPGVCLSSLDLMPGAERTASTLNKVSTDNVELDLMGGVYVLYYHYNY